MHPREIELRLQSNFARASKIATKDAKNLRSHITLEKQGLQANALKDKTNAMKWTQKRRYLALKTTK